MGKDDIPFYIASTVKAESKPGWVKRGIAGFVVFDARLTKEGIMKKLTSNASFGEVDGEGEIEYSIHFQLKPSDLEKFRDLIKEANPKGDLPFWIRFERPR